LIQSQTIIAEPSIAPGFRAALADLNALAFNNYNSSFVALTEEQQITLLTPLSLDPTTPLGKFFALAKDMTITAYYKTEVGLKTELGWHGNTFLADFPGCDHPEHHHS
jgi:Gluconate 2-dehydrogenase subunit 3